MIQAKDSTLVQQNEIDALKNENAELRTELEELKSLVKELIKEKNAFQSHLYLK